MSVSHCMGRAVAIASTAKEGWAAQIERIPEQCPHDDCGAPRNCRQRVADYLRMQWRMHQRRETAKAAKP